MIDLHTHILPCIDDGARTIDETITMIKEAKQAGFKGLALSSHFLQGYYETDNLERSVLRDLILEKENEIELYLASEIYFSENIIEALEQGKASTINNTHYVLFELPFNDLPVNLYNEIYKWHKCEIIPILAHPERYSFVQKDPNLVYELIDRGVLMQCNYGSFDGYYGKTAQKTAYKLLKNDMVHFLASDAHRMNSKYLKIQGIIKKLENVVGKDKIFKLTTSNPNLVIQDQKIEIEKPQMLEDNFLEKVFKKR